MTSHRPSRVFALAAGAAALGIGALASAPLAGPGATDLTGQVVLAADTAPSVTLGATSVKPGGDVSFTATGFPAGATLSIKFDDAALLKQFPIGDDGGVTGTVTVPADADVGGGHWLRFLAPGTSVKSEELTVTGTSPTPSPTPTPTPTRTSTPTPTPTPTPTTSRTAAPAVQLTSGSSVKAGGKVSFRLTGFVEGQNVTVKLDDGAILAQWTDAVGADGTFTGSMTVPADTAKGAHWLRFLAPDPATSLKADIQVTSAGTGNGDSGSANPGSGSDTGTGTGSGTGTGTGTATPAGASAALTGGSSVAAGGKMSFRVTGFPAGQRLTVKLDDAEILGQWTVGADGTFAGSVTVPADTAKGAHWLRFLAPNPPTSLKAGFTVTSGASASATGTSASATPVPAASGAPASASNAAGAKAEITASEVRPGGRLHFRVTKFPAGETVTVKLDDEAILGQWKADEDGSYEGDVTVPADTPVGAHWLRFLAPNPPTSLKVGFTATGADAAAGQSSAATSSTTAPDTTDRTLAAGAVEAPVSHATIAWSAAAAAAGGAAGAAVTTLLVVRRRPSAPAEPA
ncbi:hypothetical protein [Streptomyces broussonetiae]|uniref:Uncharacterized protein n=1 Tax=Streptomyces broussonetiae TaxID=2686304 RepID=A0ABV5EGC1_9ACTN